FKDKIDIFARADFGDALGHPPNKLLRLDHARPKNEDRAFSANRDFAYAERFRHTSKESRNAGILKSSFMLRQVVVRRIDFLYCRPTDQSHVSPCNVGIVLLISFLPGPPEHGPAAGRFARAGAVFWKLNLCLGKFDYNFSGGVQHRIVYWGGRQR